MAAAAAQERWQSTATRRRPWEENKYPAVNRHRLRRHACRRHSEVERGRQTGERKAGWRRRRKKVRAGGKKKKKEKTTLQHAAGNNLTEDHYLCFCVTAPFLLPVFSSGSPPAPPLPCPWESLPVGGGRRAMPQPFGLPGRCSDDAQVAGVDDDFAKVQHGRLAKANKKNSVVVRKSCRFAKFTFLVFTLFLEEL